MAIVAKFTRTLPAPTATINGGFVFLLSTGWFAQSDQGAAGSPIDGGANSLVNGGGDIQIFSDTTATTRLPIEVVTFVTGVSPQAQVWVRTPSYTVGDTITIGKDDTQISQPAFGAAFGRNATWSDFEAVVHASETETDGVFVDSTGNGHDTILSVGSTLATTSEGHPFGGSWPDLTTQQVLTLADSYDLVNNTAFTLSCWMNTDLARTNKGLFGTRYTTLEWVQIQSNCRGFTRASGRENLADVDLPAGVTRLVKLKQDTTSLDNIINGVKEATDTSLVGAETINNSIVENEFRVGAYYNGSSSYRYNGRCGEFRIKRTKDSIDLDLSEYLNQSDPDNFGISSEWVLVAGSGITLTTDEQGPSFSATISATLTTSLTTNIFEQGPSFADAINASVEGVTINANISDGGPSFSDAVNVALDKNITVDINSIGPSFTDNINITLKRDVTEDITDVGPSFSDNVSVIIPIKFTVSPKNLIQVKRKVNNVTINKRNTTIRAARTTRIIRVK